MLPELQDPHIETGVTGQLVEDTPSFTEHPFIRQARAFMKGKSHPVTYYAAVRQALPQVKGVEERAAMRLLVDIELALINAVQEEFNACNQERGEGNSRATKPADLYRRYHDALRMIVDRNRAITRIHAQNLLQDLYLEQTLSENDLQNPDYIDPYTGEYTYETVQEFEKAIPEKHEPGIEELIKYIGMAPDVEAETTSTAISNGHKETLEWGMQVKDDLGWDDETMEAFINAQMDGFDAESDDIPLLDDDVDPYTPPTLIPNDLVLDRELWYSVNEERWAFNRARSRVFEQMQKDSAARRKWRKRFGEMKHDTPLRRHWWKLYWQLRKAPGKSWHANFRGRFTQAEEFEKMITAIHDVAREDVVTAAAIYLSLAGDYGLMEGDVAHIRGLYQLPEQYYKPEQISPGAYVPLVSFASEWEDDLLGLGQDALSPASETNPHSYQDVLMDMITVDENGDIVINPAPMRAVLPRYDHNPINTASWNIGFARAAMAKTTWKQAEDAGWAEWRREMSVQAAAEYDRVYKETQDRKKAMAAFWRACPREVPRPQDHIKAIRRDMTGLVLANGREISWNVAAMKIRNDELFLTPDIKERLLKKLQELKRGQAIWSLLK
jgi:hypothetical protein